MQLEISRSNIDHWNCIKILLSLSEKGLQKNRSNMYNEKRNMLLYIFCVLLGLSAAVLLKSTGQGLLFTKMLFLECLSNF